MTDRELLELAAKAAGIEGHYRENLVAGVLRLDGIIKSRVVNAGDVPWNPLTDDGDALRLAVALEMSVDRVGNEVVVAYSNGFERERSSDDPYAATRRAIVRAAAEIGRGMT